ADGPQPLGMPLQYMVSGMAVAAGRRQPETVAEIGFNPVGQVVGQLGRVEKTSTVIERWVQEYVDATVRLEELNARV
ncbi:MAG TPA: nitronate monooxygenase, partial [Aeromicrobium sp.]|nr:nitronate monooxygenase [Aeromicrobium sp.]